MLWDVTGLLELIAKLFSCMRELLFWFSCTAISVVTNVKLPPAQLLTLLNVICGRVNAQTETQLDIFDGTVSW